MIEYRPIGVRVSTVWKWTVVMQWLRKMASEMATGKTQLRKWLQVHLCPRSNGYGNGYRCGNDYGKTTENGYGIAQSNNNNNNNDDDDDDNNNNNNNNTNDDNKAPELGGS